MTMIDLPIRPGLYAAFDDLEKHGRPTLSILFELYDDAHWVMPNFVGGYAEAQAREAHEHRGGLVLLKPMSGVVRRPDLIDRIMEGLRLRDDE